MRTTNQRSGAVGNVAVSPSAVALVSAEGTPSGDTRREAAVRPAPQRVWEEDRAGWVRPIQDAA